MRGLRVLRLFGIPVEIHASWVLALAFLTVSFQEEYRRLLLPSWATWGMGLLSGLALFASVLLHEMGHALVARRFGTEVRRITLFIFGGVAQLAREMGRPAHELAVALAGPAVSLILAVAAGLLAWSRPGPPWTHLFVSLAVANGGMLAFNLVPAFPLDGGRVLRAFLWYLSGDLERASLWAGGVAYGAAGLMVLGGVWALLAGEDWLAGGWLLFLAWFLIEATGQSLRQVRIQARLREGSVRGLMRTDLPSLGGDAPLEAAVSLLPLTPQTRLIWVREGERPVGFLVSHLLWRIPRERWGQVRAREAMIPLERLTWISPEVPLLETLQTMEQERLPFLGVGSVEAPLGILLREDLLRFLREREA